MAIKATRDETLYLQARGLRIQAPKALNVALRLALEDMQTTLYGGEAEEELTSAEQAVLRRGGLVLEEQSGRMFKPLAYTKTFAMAASSVLGITIIPVLMTFFVRERAFPEETPRRTRRLSWIAALLGAP